MAGRRQERIPHCAPHASPRVRRSSPLAEQPSDEEAGREDRQRTAGGVIRLRALHSKNKRPRVVMLRGELRDLRRRIRTTSSSTRRHPRSKERTPSDEDAATRAAIGSGFVQATTSRASHRCRSPTTGRSPPNSSPFRRRRRSGVPVASSSCECRTSLVTSLLGGNCTGDPSQRRQPETPGERTEAPRQVRWTADQVDRTNLAPP